MGIYNGAAGTVFRMNSRFYMGIFAFGLLLFGAALTLLIGDIGFQGDDWWILGVPYWNPFPDSLLVYARESLRPIEGVYWISIFELFGFNRQIFNLFSILLLGADSALFAACIYRACSDRPVLAIFTGAFAFVLPTSSALTYMIHTDNSRLAIFFCLWSIFFFQTWAQRGYPWSGMIPPVILYLLSGLTYEAATFLIFAVPLLAAPVYIRTHSRLDAKFFIRTAVGVLTAFFLFVLIRFTLQSGGVVGHKSLLPSVWLLLSYIQTFPEYIVAVFNERPNDAGSWIWAGCFTAFTALIIATAGNFVRSSRKPCIPKKAACPDPSATLISGKHVPGDTQCIRGQDSPLSSLVNSNFYPLLTGCVLILLGTAPYIMAGYSSEPGFTSQSRVYSSAGFGISLLFAMLCCSWKSTLPNFIASVLGLVLVLFMAAFFAGLRSDWQEAGKIRREICADLLRQVPDVAPGTTFLFKDLQSYLGKRAVVFQGVDGLGEFVRIMYNKKALDAYFIYPKEDIPDSEGRKATAGPAGIIPRGSLNPLPLDGLLILEKQGNKLMLLDGIAAAGDDSAIEWNGINEIKTNRERILESSNSEKFRGRCLDRHSGSFGGRQGN